MEDDHVRRAIKVWMREVMAAKDWSASEWARRAGTSPTNITRFLSPVSSIVPSSATISKLARAAGTQPRLGVMQDLNPSKAVHIANISAKLLSGFSPRQLWDYLMRQDSPVQMIAIDGPIDGPAFVVDVPAQGMVARGITLGDRILVEKIKGSELSPGHVVLIHHEGVAKIGEWQGQVIVFYPQSAGPEYHPLRTSEVEVYGRVRRLIREL